jgi:hypothetical protein
MLLAYVIYAPGLLVTLPTWALVILTDSLASQTEWPRIILKQGETSTHSVHFALNNRLAVSFGHK